MSETSPQARARGRSEHKATRRLELLEGAHRAVQRLGPGASMDDIAAEAGVTKVVLYRYFLNKGGLYQALAESFVRELMGELRAALASETGPDDRLRATIDAYVAFIEQHRGGYDFLMNRAIREGPQAQATVADFMRGLAREIGEVLAEEISRFGFDPAPSLAWAHGLVGMVHFASDWWLEQEEVSRDRLVDYLVELVARGLFGATPNVTEELRGEVLRAEGRTAG